MKIAFIGDIHGDPELLYKAMKHVKDAEFVVQLGDFGISDSMLDELESRKVKNRIHFIDGNHEDYNLLREVAGFRKGDPVRARHIWKRKLYYIPRGYRAEIDKDLIFGFLGGANSIDRHYRREGIDWFPEEMPNYREVAHLGDRVDIMVTHDAPISAQRLMGIDPLDTRNPVQLEQIGELLEPFLWIHGHYHVDYEGDLDGIQMVGVGIGGVVILDTVAGVIDRVKNGIEN